MDRLKAPTLVLAATHTGHQILLAAHRALAAVPYARPHLLTGHGHLVMETDPALVVGIVKTFLAHGDKPEPSKVVA
jgi:pimeloyl-ACP methyl ester carboxylesterase